MTLLLLLLTVSPVDAAKAHLQKGQLDDVLFDLEGKTLPAAEQPEAVKVLAAASAKSLEAKDAPMAQHLAGMALKLDARSTAALEAASRAAFAQQQFEEAEKHAEAWIGVDPKSAPARLLRAELAAEAGEWPRVIEQLEAVKQDSSKALTLEAKAKSELGQKAAALNELQMLQKTLDEAAKKAKGLGRPLRASVNEVVIYTAAWAGNSRAARDWLTRKGISFVERDIAKDMDAAMELTTKASQSNTPITTLPVFDVRGKLFVGFDPKKIEAAL